MKVNIEIVPGTGRVERSCIKHYVIIYGSVQQNEKTSSGTTAVLKKARKGIYRYEVINENKIKLRCLISKGYI